RRPPPLGRDRTVHALPPIGTSGQQGGQANAEVRARTRPPPTIQGMDPALLVVDVQQGFDDAGYWGPRNNLACEDNIAALIAHARANDWPLVYVRHDSDT